MSGCAVKLLLFAECRERVGESQVILNVPTTEITTANLVSLIRAAYPALHPVLDTVVLALNEEYVDKDAVLTLQSTDTLALIPPIAGG